jgi:uncharacterized protein (TIGR02453 family)
MTDFHFPDETRAFLDGIAAHNEKAWFDANRGLYEAGYVAAGRAFVSAMGPRLVEISPDVHFEPKINGSLSRINRDIRFSKDKRPYKTHLDAWFWHGEKRSWQLPGFWFRLTASELTLGSGLYLFDKPMLETFRQSVIHPRSGKALLAAVAEIAAAGDYALGEKTRKLLPRGYSSGDPERDAFLLYEGLNAGITLPVELAYRPGIVELCLEHFRATWPVGKWMLAELD